MRNYLTFDGVDSRAFGLYISGTGTFNSPEREYQNISIPGRDGDLLGVSTRLRNVGLSYPAFIYTGARQQLAALRGFLLSHVGYFRLVDSYNPEEYRLAVYKGPLEADPTPVLDAMQFDLVFECKPQRYLIVGETAQSITSGDTLTNPSPFTARPLIRVHGAGSLMVGADVVTVAANNYSYIDIDAEMMDCYSGADNCNALVTFAENDFPTLPAGQTGITYSGFSAVEVTPRWWRV